MASNEDHPHDDFIHDGDETGNAVEREIRRGITIMKRLIRDRDRGIKHDVHWSQDNQLIEPNGSTLTSYLGSVARREVPITCDDWRNKALKDAKDKIWSEIQVPYVMLFVFNVDYVFKVLILTHSVYDFRRGLSTLMIPEKIIYSDWPEKYIEGLDLFYQTSFLRMRIKNLLMQSFHRTMQI